ncbi:hypothetical protein Tco_1220573 [Tanacetum coccineum]
MRLSDSSPERVTAAGGGESEERQVNAKGQGNNANEAGAPAARECTFLGFMKCNPMVFHGHEGAVELRRWFEKRKWFIRIQEVAKARKGQICCSTTSRALLDCGSSQLVQLCPKMVPSERKKIEAYIRGLTDNIKGTVIGSKPTSLNEAVRMAHALMEQKAQARIERIAEGNKRKWESSQGGNT